MKSYWYRIQHSGFDLRHISAVKVKQRTGTFEVHTDQIDKETGSTAVSFEFHFESVEACLAEADKLLRALEEAKKTLQARRPVRDFFKIKGHTFYAPLVVRSSWRGNFLLVDIHNQGATQIKCDSPAEAELYSEKIIELLEKRSDVLMVDLERVPASMNRH